MSRDSVKPLIGIVASLIHLPGHSVPQHASGERYIDAILRCADAMPFIIPSLGDAHDFKELVDRLDGLFLTGGRANVEPHHYGGPAFPEDEIRDPARDATVMPLVRACLDGGVPLFGVCRGIQEMNVALGGSLHYRLHLLEGKMDHRMPRDSNLDLDERFGLRHSIALTRGGYFRELIDEDELMVNSAHGQGLDRLAYGVDVEAVAPDGVIEGIRVSGAKRFAVGVQWHAEWRHDEHALSSALFRELGEAARDRLLARTVRRRDTASTRQVAKRRGNGR